MGPDRGPETLHLPHPVRRCLVHAFTRTPGARRVQVATPGAHGHHPDSLRALQPDTAPPEDARLPRQAADRPPRQTTSPPEPGPGLCHGPHVDPLPRQPHLFGRRPGVQTALRPLASRVLRRPDHAQHGPHRRQRAARDPRHLDPSLAGTRQGPRESHRATQGNLDQPGAGFYVAGLDSMARCPQRIRETSWKGRQGVHHECQQDL